MMENEIKQENPASVEQMQNSLNRLRKRMTYVQDEMQITSFAIRCIEKDLEETLKEDVQANEKEDA
jgi:hypothetical protein